MERFQTRGHKMKKISSAHLILVIITLVLSSASLFADTSPRIAPSGQATRGIATYVEGLDPNLKVGKQYLVVIGINQYQHWLPLHSPVQDVQEIRDILLQRYYIDEIAELYDQQATKANIIKLFVELQNKVKIDDSLLILYSGHGHLDENSDTGFWIPVNAGTDIYEQHNWLPHTQLKGLIANIEANHICVISDSCFAGDLIHSTRSIPPTIDQQYFRRAYTRVSRQVLTSGATEAVPDESDFANQLKSILKRNDNRLLDTLMLYNEVRLGVGTSIPLLGALQGTGHQEGASFLLFLREDVQADPTPFGPIHIQIGPSLAEAGTRKPGYFSTGARIGAVLPLAEMRSMLTTGLFFRYQLHYNRSFGWGALGLGFSTGLTTMSTHPDIPYIPEKDYSLYAIPVGLNLRYSTISPSPWFWSVDLSSGVMINHIDPMNPTSEDLSFRVIKIFLSPTVDIGRRFFDRWLLSAYTSYLLIFFDNNFYHGLPFGLRVEYTF
jgi:hypothetical protein